MAERKLEASPTIPLPHQDKGNVLYVGVDLGTSRSSISASNGVRKTVLSVVGWPKDVISQRFIKKEVVFGQEALKNRLSLEICRPMENGSIKGSEREEEKGKKLSSKELLAAKQLIEYMIGLVEPKGGEKIYGVIGAPAEASVQSKQALIEACSGIFDAVMVVSEPFTVAYGLDLLNVGIIVDMGAGTLDLCRIHGTLPTEADQKTIKNAGDNVDMRLMEAILAKDKDAQLTKDMVRMWKETYATISVPKQPIKVEYTVHGVPKVVDITDEMRSACASILPDLIEGLKELIGSFDPEFQKEARENIILAGGLSQIRDVEVAIEEALKPLGGAKVTKVEDPIYAGSDGSLKLAMDMPDSYWQRLK